MNEAYLQAIISSECVNPPCLDKFSIFFMDDYRLDMMKTINHERRLIKEFEINEGRAKHC